MLLPCICNARIGPPRRSSRLCSIQRSTRSRPQRRAIWAQSTRSTAERRAPEPHCSTLRWPLRAALRTFLRPKGSRAPAPLQHLETAALQPSARVLVPGQPCSRATAAPRGGRQAASARFSSHGQPCSRTHCSTSRWPPGCVAHVHVSPGSRAPAPTAAPPGGRPGSVGARVLVPPAAVIPRPLQHLEVAATSSFSTCARPTGSHAPAPAQHLQVAAPAASEHVFSSHGQP